MSDTKSGARNSAADRDRIKQMREMAQMLINLSLELDPEDDTTEPIIPANRLMRLSCGLVIQSRPRAQMRASS